MNDGEPPTPNRLVRAGRQSVDGPDSPRVGGRRSAAVRRARDRGLLRGRSTGASWSADLADRALSASGRLLERAVFGGCLLVPPTTLTVVGVVNFPTGTIELTGPHSQRAVADWLGLPQLATAELRESGSTIAENPTSPAAATCTGQLEPSLLRMVLKRGGITEDREGWRAPDGRRTTAVDDAFVWALERIAQGDDGRRRWP